MNYHQEIIIIETKMKAFANKIKQQISNEGLIIYSKSREFYCFETLSFESLQLFYELIATKNYSLLNYHYIWNYYSVCLYYLANYNPKFIHSFAKRFSLTQYKIDQNRKEHLYLLYNIIEFEDKYNKFSLDEIQMLNEKLHLFSFPSKKTIEEWLLYAYYERLLGLLTKSPNQSRESFNETISAISDYSSRNQLSPFINYIELKNRLLNFQIYALTNMNDLNQLASDYNSILNYVNKFNHNYISIPIGLKMFDIYKSKNEYNNCLAIIQLTYQFLKKEMCKGNKINNCIRYLLEISTRMAYSNMLLNNRDGLIHSVKKLQKYIRLNEMNSDQQMKKQLKDQFSSCLLFYEQRLNYTGLNNKNSSILLYFKTNYRKFIQNESEEIINIYAMNNIDPISGSYYRLFESNRQILDNCQAIPLNLIVSTIISVYNSIAFLTKSIITDSNIAKLRQYLDEMRKTSSIVLKYIHTFHLLISFKQIIYIKEAIVNTSFCFIGSNYLLKNYTEAYNDLLVYEQGINKYLNIDSDTLVPFDNIIKLKGDIFFKMKQFDNAIEFYLKALMSIGNKMKKAALIRFNIGVCYIFLNNKRQGLYYLNLSLANYSKLFKNDNLVEYQNKFNIVTKMIFKINV